MKVKYLLILLLFNAIITSNEPKKQEGGILDHCIEYNVTENSSICLECEDRYFLYYLDNLCIPCNDSFYGQIGCEGNCDGSEYEKSKFAFCEEKGCKEGYYNLNGFCFNCSDGSPGCSKCTYEAQSDNFICNECINNEYRLNEFGRCEHCYLNLCEVCHYDDINGKAICDKCVDGAYNNSTGECSLCKEYAYIDGGYCRICSDNETDYEKGTCWCSGGFTLINNSICFPCPDGCSECDYNSKTDSSICKKCYENYVMDEEKNCISCENDCKYCSLNEIDNSTTCISCYSGILLPDNKCAPSILDCSKTIINGSSDYKNESICEECNYYNFILNLDKTCTYCHSNPGTGEGCDRCIFDDKEKKYKCLDCYHYENEIYGYINNTFECFYNDYEFEQYSYGCIEANYNGTTFECLKCKKDFIYIANDKICKKYDDIKRFYNCLEAENLGTNEDPLYSCKICKNDLVLVTINSTLMIKDCYPRENNLSYCLEGKIDENGNTICTQCVENSLLNGSGVCECNFDSFGKDQKWCYKCDDKIEGNPGCVSEKGCNYIHSNDKLNCNDCKEGYFKYTKGQCYSCNFEIPNCNKCYFDRYVKCQSCLDTYKLNNKKNKCDLNECEEYPDISPGCIICKDKLDEYKPNNKCQSCKYGYFKTKDEKCIYCRDEKYGGPGCYECGYEINDNNEETDNIICKTCFSIDKFYNFDHNYNNYEYNRFKYNDYFISVLSSKGKCYIAKYDLSDPCLKYEFVKDNNNNEKLSCRVCYNGYYLDSNGNCINFIDNIEIIPNCNSQILETNNFKFYYYPYNEKNIIVYYQDSNDYFTYFNIFNEYIKNMSYPIKSTCDYCKSGYYININGECEPINIENCTVRFIIQNIHRRENPCYNLCNEKNYPFIYLKLINDSIDYDYVYDKNISNINSNDLRTIDSILYDFNLFNDRKLKEFFLDNYICYIPSDEKINKEIKGCEKMLYIPKNNTFQCIECKYNYEMDYDSNICKYNGEQGHCVSENLGTELNPLYSCKSCYYEDQILVTYENGIKDCIDNYYDNLLKNCLEANANSFFVKPTYNCTSCKNNYTTFYNEFYQRIICIKADDDIITINNKEKIEDLKYYESIPINENDTCNQTYFTPDNKHCYLCNSTYIGMPGCKGECSFSLKRNNMILCESECKDGYIETSKGICETCNSVDYGCNLCHYEENYPLNYLGIKKARRFVCDGCMDDYEISQDGTCIYSMCSIWGCDNCTKDNETGEYKCIQCKDNNYGVNEWGYCTYCTARESVVNGKCIKCGDVKQGGIAHCSFCQQNEERNGMICRQCNDDYILLTDNNTCLKREGNEKLKEFDSCLELKSGNGKLVCSLCKPRFSLLKIDDINSKCIYQPTLYDSNFKSYYYFHYFYDIFNHSSSDFYNYLENDYNFDRSIYFPCKESINIGNKENPIYSCIKCFNLFENEEYDREYYYYDYFYDYYFDIDYLYNYDYIYFDKYYKKYTQYFPVKITDITKNNISYCTLTTKYDEYCLEATYQIISGKKIYNCTKCRGNYELKYSFKQDIYYCSEYEYEEEEEEEEKCLVEFCETCDENNYYFCSKCISTDYEINTITGACVEKTETIPSVTWKDVFRLNMNDKKEINGQTIIGPSLTLRGITSNQINTRHAFLVYLTFKLRNGLRNLQEDTIKIPAICQIKNGVNKTDDNINIVDYECIGNNSDKNTLLNENYELSSIEERENTENIKNADFNKINEIIKEEKDNLFNKTDSEFIDLNDIIIFSIIEKEQNITSNVNNIFNFTLNGKINKDIPLESDTPYDTIVEMYNITDKPKSTFYLEKDKNAKLNIILELKNDIKKDKISFLNSEIKVNNNYTIFVPLLNDIELYNFFISDTDTYKTDIKSEETEEAKTFSNILFTTNSIIDTEISKTTSQNEPISNSLFITDLTDTTKGQIEKCLVEFCRNCLLGTNYFCEVCNNSNYEVNKIIGSCVKKTEFVPLITWKDIYKFTLNSQKEVNGKIIKGPTFKLRGITSSQINERHAFSLYLNFRKKKLIRILQERPTIQAWCINDVNVEEKSDDVNIIDYECIGIDTKNIINDRYELISIDNDAKNDQVIINSNIKGLNKKIEKKEHINAYTSYTNSKMIIFKVNKEDINEKFSVNNVFNFSLNGKIKNNEKTYVKCIKDIQVEMYNIYQKSNITFCSKDKQNGRLDVFLNLNNDQNNKTIYFGNSEIEIENGVPMYIPALNKIKLNYEYSPIRTFFKKSSSNSKIKTSILVLCIILPVIFVGALIGVAIFLTKRKSIITNNNLDNNNAISGSQIYNSSSTNAVDKAE